VLLSYVVTHDLGDVAGGIHPHNKTAVGIRLALEVRAKVYGAKGLPRVSSATRSTAVGCEGGKRLGVDFSSSTTRLRWGPTHNCSVCCSAATQVVQVCTDANCTSPATAWQNISAACAGGGAGSDPFPPSLQAKVLGPAPRAVRYAWSNYPECVLFDQNQLPVGPFSLQVNAIKI